MSRSMNEISPQEWMTLAMVEGTASVPHLLIKYYRQLELSETDVMVLIHLIDFKEKEQKDFPTLDEIQSRMSASPEEVTRSLQKLLKSGAISIDERVDPISGIRFESYNFTHAYRQAAACRIKEERERSSSFSAFAGKGAGGEAGLSDGADASEKKDIFTVMEKEFARPLSPMECETISGWLDQDRYPEALILAALKEAVFAGKVHFRYIDRILLEWSRNRVFTAEQAREYTRKFRGER